MFSMVSPFYSVQDPSPWWTDIQGGSSFLSYPSLELSSQARPEFVSQLIPGPIKLTADVNAYMWKLIACLKGRPDADSMFAKTPSLP